MLRHEVLVSKEVYYDVGPALLKKIGSKSLRHADDYITHISSKKDYFSNFGLPLAIPDLFFNTLGLKTAGNFGKRLDVQAIHKKQTLNHQDILEAMLTTCYPKGLSGNNFDSNRYEKRFRS